MRLLTKILATAVTMTFAVVGLTSTAQAAPVTGLQGLTNLYTISVWGQPASQEQQLCAAFKKNPSKITALLTKATGALASTQAQLGLTAAQGSAAAAAGMQQACSSKPNNIVPANAIAGLVAATLPTTSAPDQAAVCVLFSQNPQQAVSQFTKQFSNLPVSAANVATGINTALTSFCAS